MKRTIGYEKRCSCGGMLEDETYFFSGFNPLNFNYKIQKCPYCKRKYVADSIDDFCTVEPFEIVLKCLLAMLRWALLAAIPFFIIYSITQSNIIAIIYAIVFIIIYFSIYLIKYNKKYNEFKKRMNDIEYIKDLISVNLLDSNKIKNYYENKIITEETYQFIIKNENI